MTSVMRELFGTRAHTEKRGSNWLAMLEIAKDPSNMCKRRTSYGRAKTDICINVSATMCTAKQPLEKRLKTTFQNKAVTLYLQVHIRGHWMLTLRLCSFVGTGVQSEAWSPWSETEARTANSIYVNRSKAFPKTC